MTRMVTLSPLPPMSKVLSALPVRFQEELE